MTASEKTLLTFPCQYPIKVMGYKSDNLTTHVYHIVKQYVPDLTENQIVARESKAGKYLALSLTFEATSKQQVDDIYRALNASEEVLMCL